MGRKRGSWPANTIGGVEAFAGHKSMRTRRITGSPAFKAAEERYWASKSSKVTTRRVERDG